jgi:hypothetical protein
VARELVTAFCSAHFLIDCAQRGKYWAKILFANPFGAIHFSRVIAAADKRLTDWLRRRERERKKDFWLDLIFVCAALDLSRRRERDREILAQQTSKSFPPPNAALFSSFIRNVKWCMSTNSLSFAPTKLRDAFLLLLLAPSVLIESHHEIKGLTEKFVLKIPTALSVHKKSHYTRRTGGKKIVWILKFDFFEAKTNFAEGAVARWDLLFRAVCLDVFWRTWVSTTKNVAPLGEVGKCDTGREHLSLASQPLECEFLFDESQKAEQSNTRDIFIWRLLHGCLKRRAAFHASLDFLTPTRQSAEICHEHTLLAQTRRKIFTEMRANLPFPRERGISCHSFSRLPPK